MPPGSAPAGGAGSAGASPGGDWGAANSRPGKEGGQTPPGEGGYPYSKTGRVAKYETSIWRISVRKDAGYTWWREHRLGPGESLALRGGISTFLSSDGTPTVNAFEYYVAGRDVLSVYMAGVYGMPKSELAIHITARPEYEAAETEEVGAEDVGPPEGWEPATDFPRIPAPPTVPPPLPGAKPAVAPPKPEPRPEQDPQPDPQRQPEAPPQPPAQPQAPPRPGPQPMPLPAPSPARGPSSVPARPQVGPPNVGTGRAVGPARVAPPATGAGVATTPAGRKIVGRPGSPVVVDPVSVPETLAGIAAEVGRIESKVGSLLARQVPEVIDWEWLLDQIALLLDRGGEAVPGVTYQIRRPCGRGADGSPLPPVLVHVPTGADATEAILLRLDAIAELIDEQKQVRQPVCKGKAQGAPVTVTFEEV